MTELITPNNAMLTERYLTDADINRYKYKTPDGTYAGSDLSFLGLTSLYTKDGFNILLPHLKWINFNSNRLTNLCELPPSTLCVHCCNNLLTLLPNNLPPQLKVLLCSNNKLTILPDLPITLEWVDFTNNPLEENYPQIFTFNNGQSREIVAYINHRNRMMRAPKYIAQMDPTNYILEHYMRRMMHPLQLAPLTNDESIDVDEYMNNYVESL